MSGEGVSASDCGAMEDDRAEPRSPDRSIPDGSPQIGDDVFTKRRGEQIFCSNAHIYAIGLPFAVQNRIELGVALGFGLAWGVMMAVGLASVAVSILRSAGLPI